jgi:endonuclease/exonuclease/phosphatase family metal-dependent hydrolase
VASVVRTWNLFHGNADPPERRAFLRQMVELVSADSPAVVCLQEVPGWALRYLKRWSGMHAFGAMAARPRLGSVGLGRWVTELDHSRFRSAFTGQANAILVAPELDARAEPPLVLSERGERRVCQLLRTEAFGAVGNFHVTGGQMADGQFRRALDFVAAADERAIIAGDANLRPRDGGAYVHARELGFAEPLCESIDQVLARGLAASQPQAWPEERRRVGGRLLSDHAPVEISVE